MLAGAVVAVTAACAYGGSGGAASAPSAARTPYVGITASNHHTCAVTSKGGVKCWGINTSGQAGTGDSDTALYRVPVDVFGLARGVRTIDAGNSHTCALTTGGGLRCWGNNSSGQLGRPTTARSDYTPAAVHGFARGAAAISAGADHTCALTSGGGVKCWGANVYGQLGNGKTGPDSRTPVSVVGLAGGVKAINAGGSGSIGHSCAVTSGGGVKCWGNGDGGQLGNGAMPRFQPVPVDVAVSRAESARSAPAAGMSARSTSGGG